MQHWAFICSSLVACDAYKFLVNSPLFGYSHTNFMGAIADTLTEAGHNVTVLMPVMEIEQKDKTGLKLTKNVIKIPADQRVYDIMRHEREMLSHIWTTGNSVLGLLKALTLHELQRFDLKAFPHRSGIFEVLKIPATIATFSGVHIDCVSKSIGEPITPASWSATGDRMNFFGRLGNFVNVLLVNIFFTRTYDEEIKVFRLISKASFVFTNSNPYLDYPRPVLHKTVAIGGIAVAVDQKKNELSKEWDDILNKRNTTVLVSFGSVVKSIYMPEQYKKTLLEVFESMPETTFIWKYEEEGSTIAGHLKNVHLSTWVPQNALLADSRLTVFITHGGLASTTELAYMGKPIPVFADQTRNANMFSKHGCGIVLTKYELEHPQKLRDSLIKIFNDASFSDNARLLSEILRNQPISPKQLLVRHSEFAARFGTLPNLDPYGRHLSLLEYYLIDVLLACVFAFLLVVFVIVKLLRKCLSLREKTKTE
ncbi:unnamed protein product [Angiostrongylus costaricensis]|uniref:glucuronosyltransferase n=1 Tax=Angiostrongylus costaricensis TaxID=334426 RepID=A0A0R3PSW2_ANGCS|nr:unnamed protein product [Angiostrongylus costaricensis]